jgi:hypothetical protein
MEIPLVLKALYKPLPNQYANYPISVIDNNIAMKEISVGRNSTSDSLDFEKEFDYRHKDFIY